MRLRTPRGPVHVWTPSQYDADTADVVIFVHGYYVTVDETWRSVQAQFEESGLNAMFVVPGAPSAHVDPVDWESLDQLLAAVGDLPRGRVLAIAHSGGHRTIRSWVAGKRLDGLVMLDAAYGTFPEIEAWLAASPDHRLIDLSELTRPWANDLHGHLPESLVLDALPAEPTDELRGARVIHVRSSIGHAELVSGGVAIPTVLRWFAR